MSAFYSLTQTHERWLKGALCVIFVACLSACAATPSPDPAGPRANESLYPPLLTDDGSRREAALAAWANFTRALGIANAPAPELQPVTATLRSIPALSETPLYLPKVGEGVPMTEEETRESLRRFIAETGPLLCGDQQQLSLIQRIDGANGGKEARYQQRPFRYSLRGGYGEVRISFAPDRRVIQMSSSCIPDSDIIRRGFVGLGQQMMPVEKALESIAGQAVAYDDASGNRQTLTLPQAERLNARELVIYPLERAGEPATLEFHVAWEVLVEDAPKLAIYLDSVSGKVIGTGQIQ